VGLTLISGLSENEETEIEEEVTHLKFPVAIKDMKLWVTSVRTVTFLKFATYAFGLYLGPEISQKLEKEITTASSEDMTHMIWNSDQSKLVRFVLYRPIDTTHFLSSMNQGINKSLDSLNLDKSIQDELLSQFKNCFKMKNIPVKTNIDFYWRDGALTVFINGEETGTIKDKNFGWAFFGLYMGDQPRATEIKKAIITKFNRLKI